VSTPRKRIAVRTVPLWEHVCAGFRHRYKNPVWMPVEKWPVSCGVLLVHDMGTYLEVFLRRNGSKFHTLVAAFPFLSREQQWRDAFRRKIMGVFDKLPSSNGKAGSGPLPEDSDFLEAWPGLWELMTETKYPDGKDRERSSLTVFIEEGSFKLCISERTRELSCWATGPTFKRALDALEGRVVSDSPEWRASGRGKKKK
jgi:hypothetical protein